jgi:hypothetical protein
MTENEDNAMNVYDPLLRSLLIKDRRAELERLETRSIGLRTGRDRRFTKYMTTAHTSTTKEKVR